MKKNILHKSINLILIFGLIFMPSSGIVFAQVSDTNASSTESTKTTTSADVANDTSANASSALPIINNPDKKIQNVVDTTVVQDTANTQESLSGKDLTSTATDTEIILNNSSSTNTINASSTASSTASTTDLTYEDYLYTNDDHIPSIYDQFDMTSDYLNDADRPAKVNQTEGENNIDSATIVPTKPRAVFSFSVNRHIPSRKKIANPDKQNRNLNMSRKGKNASFENIPDTVDVQVDAVINPVIDNESGAISFSGTCSNTYFVVLLYKNLNDYDEDPGSYILNKAFKCINGSYSYSINDLPNSLPSGTYYLLIGDQGERGGWTPATQLTEININKV